MELSELLNSLIGLGDPVVLVLVFVVVMLIGEVRYGRTCLAVSQDRVRRLYRRLADIPEDPIANGD